MHHTTKRMRKEIFWQTFEPQELRHTVPQKSSIGYTLILGIHQFYCRQTTLVTHKHTRTQYGRDIFSYKSRAHANQKKTEFRHSAEEQAIIYQISTTLNIEGIRYL